MKIRQHLALYTLPTLILLAMTSCASPDSATQLPTKTAIPSNVIATNALANSMLTATSVFPTPEVTPRVKTLVYNPEQVTDGKLKLSIEEAKKDTCYKPGTWIPLVLTYENLTDQALKIFDYNLISSHLVGGSYGRLHPVLATEQNIQILSLEDSMLITLYNPNPPLIQVLHPNNTVQAYASYYLSTEFASAGNIDSQFQPIPDGKYYLKFGYIASGYEDSWEGMITSNRILICVNS